MKKVKIILLTMLFIMIGITVSNASYNASNKKVTSGDEVTITVTSTEELDAYNLDLTDKGGLTFVNCSKAKEGDAIISTNENGSIGYMNPSGKTKTLGTYKFKTPDVTETKTYTVVFSVNQGEANPKALITVEPKKQENPTGGNTSSGTQTPKPDPEPEKVKLQSLKINSTTYIKQLKTNLSTTVEGQEYITLLPKTSDGSLCTITNTTNNETKTVKSGASQKIKLNEGTNKITIKGKFEETYTVTVTNKEKEEETPPNVIEEPKPEDIKVILKSLTVKGIKLVTEENDKEEKVDLILTPEFSSEVYEYTINIPEEQNDITKLDVSAIGDKEDFTVEITGNENLVDGENIITILVKSKDGEKTTEYKIKVNKVAKVVEAVTEPILDETPNTGVEDNFKDIIKLVIGGFIILIAVVAIVVVLIKFRKKEDDEEIETFDDMKLEDNEINLQEKNTEDEIDYNSSEDNNHSKGIDFTSILKNKIEEKNEISNRKRMEKERNEELENIEETFEVLKEENTASKKRGKHF